MKYHKWTISLIVLTLFFIKPQLMTVLLAEETATGIDKRVVAVIGADGVQRVDVTGGEYYFDPNHIVVKVNIPVELMARKAGGFIPHNIIVKAPEAGIEFNVGLKKDPQPIRFIPTKTGKYPMYCDKRFLFFKTHRAKGMEGIIEVVE